MASPTPAEIRNWARNNGFAMPDRGPLSAEVRAAYANAHRSGAKKGTASASLSASRRAVKGAPVDRPAVKVADLGVVADRDALARTIAELSKRVSILEQQVGEIRATQLRRTKRFGRRS